MLNATNRRVGDLHFPITLHGFRALRFRLNHGNGGGRILSLKMAMPGTGAGLLSTVESTSRSGTEWLMKNKGHEI